jgi:hypothetical protein
MEAVAHCGDVSEAVVQSPENTVVPFESSATATLRAPEGTTLAGLTGEGLFKRPDCRWTAQFATDGILHAGVKGFEFCEETRAFIDLMGSLEQPKTFSLEVECRDPAGCPVGPPGPDPWFLPQGAIVILRRSVLTVRDEVPPAVGVLGVGRGGERWVRGTQPVRYHASDGSGIREATLVVAGQREPHPAVCDHTRLSPCPQGDGELIVDTRRLPDGVNPLRVEVVDAGANTSAASFSAYVDNTAPGPVRPHVEGGSAWRRSNAFTVGWDAGAEDHAPIVAAHYRVCRVGTSECAYGSRTGTGVDRLADVAVPGAGEWTLQTWREDEAGNVDQGLASPPVLLRLDDAPPAVRFEPRELDDPRRVSAVVSDAVSGVAGGEIQLRPAGGGAWRSLPTDLDRGRLTAEVDEDRLGPGIYEMRAVARDHAGNEGATHTLPDGSAAVLRLPLRARARLTAGIVKTRAKRKPRLLPSATVAFDRRLRLSGRLTNQDGHPVASAQLYVYSRSRVDARERFAGTVTTNRSGEFTYRIRARASGTVRILYQGSRLLGSAERKVGLKVPAASVLKVNARRVLNGDEVVFKGRLRGRPFPRPGKIIHLQAHYGRKGWSNFGKAHRAEPNGRWRIPYRFENTRGVVHYKFRVLVPREQDYPFETGASNTVRVTVRGR